MLLASRDVQQKGIGNRHDVVGRYYMSHLAATAGYITFSGPPATITFDYERDAAGVYVRRRLAVTAEAQRELGWSPTIPLREGLQRTIAYFEKLLSEGEAPKRVEM